MQLRIAFALILTLTVAMLGCKEKEPEVPPPPPLPSEGAIYSSLQESLNLLLVRGGPTDEETKQEINKFRKALSENAADPALYTLEQIQVYQDARKNARRSIQKDIEDRIRSSRDLGGWRIVEGCIQAYEVLQPDNPRYADLKEKARKMINMPVVTNKGNMEIDGIIRAIFEITDPVTNRTETERVREGEFFFNNRFRLTQIVGNNLEYIIEYADVDDHTFTVPSTKRF